MAAFPEIELVRYEGPDSKNPLAFRHYDADEWVEGRPMKEHFRFSVVFWHTFRGTGRSPHNLVLRCERLVRPPPPKMATDVLAPRAIDLHLDTWARVPPLKGLSEELPEAQWHARAPYHDYTTDGVPVGEGYRGIRRHFGLDAIRPELSTGPRFGAGQLPVNTVVGRRRPRRTQRRDLLDDVQAARDLAPSPPPRAPARSVPRTVGAARPARG